MRTHSHREFATGLRNPVGLALEPETGAKWTVVNERDELGSDRMFIGQHGSWNRSPRSGYKVIFVPFSTGRPAGVTLDVLIGFLNEAGEAMGRPVGVAIDGRGALLVADDVGSSIWRVIGATTGKP